MVMKMQEPVNEVSEIRRTFDPYRADQRPPISSGTEFISQIVALQMLARLHPKQREINDDRVLQYAREIENGGWQVIGDAVTFDCDDCLVEGQHRLQAVVLAGIGVWMVVVRGVDRGAIIAAGRGRIRSEPDNLRMAGLGNYTTGFVSTARCMMMGLRTFAGRSETATTGELSTFIRRHNEVIDLAQKYLAGQAGATRAIRGAVARALVKGDRDRIREWCQVVRTGMPVSHPPIHDSAAIVFAAFMHRNTGAAGSAIEIERYTKTQASIRHFVARAHVTRLYGDSDEAFPLD